MTGKNEKFAEIRADQDRKTRERITLAVERVLNRHSTGSAGGQMSMTDPVAAAAARWRGDPRVTAARAERDKAHGRV